MKNIILILVFYLLPQLAVAQDSSRQSRFNQYGRIVSRSPLDVENRNGILVFETPDQSYRLWFDIRVQVDAQLFSRNTLNPIGNGASIRRARFATKTNLTKNWYGELDLDFANGILELNDAYIQYDFRNGVAARVGNFKERFSMSQTSSSRYLNFLERPMAVVALTPSRHLGLEASYSAPYFLVSSGIFGQAIEDAEVRINVEDNNKDYGRSEGISWTSKLAIQPFSDKVPYGGHLAFAHSYRQPKTSAPVSEYGGIRYSTRSLSSINRKKYLDTDVIPNFRYSSLNNLEMAWYYKGLGIQSEYFRNRVYRESDLSNLDFDGFYAQAACLLFGGKQFYNRTEAEFSQPYRGKKWGDIEVALRYDYINLNDKDIYGGSAEGYTAGVNFYADKNVRFQLNYSYVNHDRYASGKKKLFVGYDVTGALTKDPTQVIDSKGKAGEDYGMLGFRFEINF